MPVSNVIHGKAFEYACLVGIAGVINGSGRNIVCIVQEDGAYHNAKRCFEALPLDSHRGELLHAGEKIAEKLKSLEPRLTFSVKDLSDEVFLSIHPDACGIAGDVRDVLAAKIQAASRQKGWQIGISCKHNHAAVRHQRISPNIDIGVEWFGFPSDENYWKDIRSVFLKVSQYRVNSRISLWRNIPNKPQEIYYPAMVAVRGLFDRIYRANSAGFCSNLLHYLIGREDFYKVILNRKERQVQIEAFNFNKTLNQPAGGQRPLIQIKRLKFPTQLNRVYFKKDSKNTLLIEMNEGWQISMRVHNASSRLEQSLKLDVQLVGVPRDLYRELIVIF